MRDLLLLTSSFDAESLEKANKMRINESNDYQMIKFQLKFVRGTRSVGWSNVTQMEIQQSTEGEAEPVRAKREQRRKKRKKSLLSVRGRFGRKLQRPHQTANWHNENMSKETSPFIVTAHGKDISEEEEEEEEDVVSHTNPLLMWKYQSCSRKSSIKS